MDKPLTKPAFLQRIALFHSSTIKRTVRFMCVNNTWRDTLLRFASHSFDKIASSAAQMSAHEYIRFWNTANTMLRRNNNSISADPLAQLLLRACLSEAKRLDDITAQHLSLRHRITTSAEVVAVARSCGMCQPVLMTIGRLGSLLVAFRSVRAGIPPSWRLTSLSSLGSNDETPGVDWECLELVPMFPNREDDQLITSISLGFSGLSGEIDFRFIPCSVAEIVLNNNWNLVGEVRFQDMSHLVRLERFVGQQCGFTGISSFAHLPPSLLELDLENNKIRGELDLTTFAANSQLQKLKLGRNALTCQTTSPLDFSRLPRTLVLLRLSYNALSGNLVLDKNLAPSVTCLELESNHFSGRLDFTGIARHPSISTILLFDNEFTGVPLGLYSLPPQLHRLVLSNNNGLLPPSGAALPIGVKF